MSHDTAHKEAERVKPKGDYAGDVAPEEAWRLLSEDSTAVLIDVRTQPEWVLVGGPDLSAIGKETVFVSWQMFPAMNENPKFAAELATRNVTPDQTLLFICRSGNRSANAAEAMTSRGYSQCYNVLEGFEGALDSSNHRSSLGGWKARGLPWIQG